MNEHAISRWIHKQHITQLYITVQTRPCKLHCIHTNFLYSITVKNRTAKTYRVHINLRRTKTFAYNVRRLANCPVLCFS